MGLCSSLQKQDSKEVDILKDEIEKLHLKQLYVISNVSDHLGFELLDLWYNAIFIMKHICCSHFVDGCWVRT